MTEDDWWALLGDELPDALTASAFADFLEERGDTRSEWLRWLAASRPEPRECDSHYLSPDVKVSFDWWRESYFFLHYPPDLVERHSAARIPNALFDSLSPPECAGSWWNDLAAEREYPSRAEAYAALWDAMRTTVPTPAEEVAT